jgi:predicted amidohydrolase
VKIEVAAAQFKPRKGDYAANLERIGDIFSQIEEEAPETGVLVLPETVLSGYFLEGGVREAARSSDAVFADLLQVYRERVSRPDAILDISLGFYEIGDGRFFNSSLYATLTAANDHGAALLHVHRKFFLPTYGVFDEKRFVSRGQSVQAFNTRFGRVAMLICEDAWHSVTATIAALKGAQILYILSASPGREFDGAHVGSVDRWNGLLPGIAQEHNVWVIYAGLVGFEGGKGFSGSSRIVDPWGGSLVVAPALDECLVRATIDMEDVAAARAASPLLADLQAAVGDIALDLDEIVRRPHAQQERRQ